MATGWLLVAIGGYWWLLATILPANLLATAGRTGLFSVFEDGEEAVHGFGPSNIGLDTFERVAKIALYHFDEAKRFFTAESMPAEMADAKRILEWMWGECARGWSSAQRCNSARRKLIQHVQALQAWAFVG